VSSRNQAEEVQLKAGARQKAIFDSANFSILLSVALLTGATSRANAAHPTTYVYVLLGGFAGADGYMDSSGMLLLARRIAWIPHTWVESYNWADWVTAANRIWALA
jgi:hypothetical protein